MARPVQTCPGSETTIFAVLPCVPFHAVMFPVIEAKMKFAGPAGEGGVGITKSEVELLTVPVGSAPGMVMVCGLALSTTGAPPTSPFINCVVLTPLLAFQKGLE